MDENHGFTDRIFRRSGISPTATYLPPWINPVHTKEPKTDMDHAKKEAEMVMIGAVSDLLEKTGAFYLNGFGFRALDRRCKRGRRR